MKTWMRNSLILVAVIAIIGCSVLFVSSLQGRVAAEEEISEPIARVVQGAIEETVSANGSVTSAESANLVFSASGRIESVTVAEGDVVRAGQRLASVEATSLKQQLARAEAQLATVQARLEQAKKPATRAELDQAEAQLAQAKRPATKAEIASAQASVDSAQASLDKLLAGATEYEIAKAELAVDSAKNSLWSSQAQRDATKGSRAASGASVDSAEAQVLIAEVAVQQAQVSLKQVMAAARDEDIAMSRAQVAQAEAQLAQLLERPKAEEIALAEAQLAQLVARPSAEAVAVAQAQLDEAQLAYDQALESMADALVQAPFSGTIMSVNVNEGDWAQPGSPAISIADTENLVLDVLLDEVDVAKVAEGQRAVLAFEALPDAEAHGTVKRIAPGATQTSSGVAYRVEIRFARGDLAVKPGMTTNVEIITESVEDALLVPSRAVTADRENDRYTVTKKTTTGTRVVEVEIGLRDDSHTQIVSGLSEGDILVLNTIDLGENESGGGLPFGPGAR